MQQIAMQAGVRNLTIYICNYDLPAPDMTKGRIPPPPEHLSTVMQVCPMLRTFALYAPCTTQ